MAPGRGERTAAAPPIRSGFGRCTPSATPTTATLRTVGRATPTVSFSPRPGSTCSSARSTSSTRSSRGTVVVELVSDRHVAGIYGVQAQIALGERLLAAHEVPQGEAAKAGAVLEHLWRELEGDRSRDDRRARRWHGDRRRRSSPRRPICAVCRGCRCRRRSSGRSTPRSAARPRSTCRPARTSSARSTGRPVSSSTPACSRRWPRRR